MATITASHVTSLVVSIISGVAADLWWIYFNNLTIKRFDAKAAFPSTSTRGSRSPHSIRHNLIKCPTSVQSDRTETPPRGTSGETHVKKETENKPLKMFTLFMFIGEANVTTFRVKVNEETADSSCRSNWSWTSYSTANMDSSMGSSRATDSRAPCDPAGKERSVVVNVHVTWSALRAES